MFLIVSEKYLQEKFILQLITKCVHLSMNASLIIRNYCILPKFEIKKLSINGAAISLSNTYWVYRVLPTYLDRRAIHFGVIYYSGWARTGCGGIKCGRTK